jgi:hypothetical protein
MQCRRAVVPPPDVVARSSAQQAIFREATGVFRRRPDKSKPLTKSVAPMPVTKLPKQLIDIRESIVSPKSQLMRGVGKYWRNIPMLSASRSPRTGKYPRSMQCRRRRRLATDQTQRFGTRYGRNLWLCARMDVALTSLRPQRRMVVQCLVLIATSLGGKAIPTRSRSSSILRRFAAL